MPVQALVILLGTLIVGCGGGSSSSESDQSTNPLCCDVNISAYPMDAGSVTKTNGTVDVTVTAVASEGFRFLYWKGHAGTIVSHDPIYEGITAPAWLVAHFEEIPDCNLSTGMGADFSYSWSLETKQVTITNDHECDSLFIWASTTPPYDDIFSVREIILPSETIAFDAPEPMYLSWKPEIIFSTDNEQTYIADSAYTKQDVLLLDHDSDHQAQLLHFADMHSIEASEDRRGGCHGFSWLDRDRGSYQVAPDNLSEDFFCYVGNIIGYTSYGDSYSLPALRYFITDTSTTSPLP